MDVLQYFRWSDAPGHASYALLALSYMCTNLTWLRVLAVVGLLLEIAYFYATSPDMYAGVAWDVVFLAINLWQLARVARLRAPLPASEMALLRAALPQLDDARLAHLVSAGARRAVADGMALTRQRAPVPDLAFLLAGEALVRVDGTAVARLSPGHFVGEMAYLTGEPASADVAMEGEGVALMFERGALDRAAATDPDLSAALHRLIGRDLARKMAAKNAGVRVAEA